MGLNMGQDMEDCEKKDNETIEYYCLPAIKLAILSLATLGLYSIFWFYENWRIIKIYDKSNIHPFARAIFSVFYGLSLFKKIYHSADIHGVRSIYKPLNHYLLFLALSSIIFLPDPWWLLAGLNVLPFLAIQKVIQINNRKIDPSFRTKKRFSKREIAITITSVALLLFGLIQMI